MKLIVTTVQSVEPWGENLSLVKVHMIDKTVVANRREDGSFRWAVGQPVIYVPENAIIPEAVLKQRGYWDEAKNRGLLGGSKNNRVKNRVFGRTETDPGVESSGLLFRVENESDPNSHEMKWWVVGGAGLTAKAVTFDMDVAEFLGVTEYRP